MNIANRPDPFYLKKNVFYKIEMPSNINIIILNIKSKLLTIISQLFA